MNKYNTSSASRADLRSFLNHLEMKDISYSMDGDIIEFDETELDKAGQNIVAKLFDAVDESNLFKPSTGKRLSKTDATKVTKALNKIKGKMLKGDFEVKVFNHKDDRGPILYVSYTSYKDRSNIAQWTEYQGYSYDNDGRFTNRPNKAMGVANVDGRSANWMSFIKESVNEAKFNYKETGLSGQNLKDVKDGIRGIKNALKRGDESAVISNYDLVQQRLQQYGGPKASEFLKKIKQLAGLDESVNESNLRKGDIEYTVNEGYHSFKGKMKKDLTLGGKMGGEFDIPKKSDMPKVTFKRGEDVELEIQPNSYHIYGKGGKHGYMDKQLAPQLRFMDIDDYVMYESVNEGLSNPMQIQIRIDGDVGSTSPEAVQSKWSKAGIQFKVDSYMPDRVEYHVSGNDYNKAVKLAKGSLINEAIDPLPSYEVIAGLATVLGALDVAYGIKGGDSIVIDATKALKSYIGDKINAVGPAAKRVIAKFKKDPKVKKIIMDASDPKLNKRAVDKWVDILDHINGMDISQDSKDLITNYLSKAPIDPKAKIKDLISHSKEMLEIKESNAIMEDKAVLKYYDNSHRDIFKRILRPYDTKLSSKYGGFVFDLDSDPEYRSQDYKYLQNEIGLQLDKAGYEENRDYGFQYVNENVSNEAKSDIKLFEEFFVNEAKEATRGAIYKAVKKADYPVAVVVIEKGAWLNNGYKPKVVHQQLVNTPEAVPAAVKTLQKKYPLARISVESKSGLIVFTESVKKSSDIKLFEEYFDSLNEAPNTAYRVVGDSPTSKESNHPETVWANSEKEAIEKYRRTVKPTPINVQIVKEANSYDSWKERGNQLEKQAKADAINAFGKAAKRKDFEEMVDMFVSDREINGGEYLDAFRIVLKKYNLVDKFRKQLADLDITKTPYEMNEAQKYDIAAAIRAIRDYNRSGKSNEEFENMAISIVKDLGFKPTGNNVDNVMDHLGASSIGADRIPEDAAIVRELYPMLESLTESVRYLYNPQRLIDAALRLKWITKEEARQRETLSVAKEQQEEDAEDQDEDGDFGSSDFSFSLMYFMKKLGYNMDVKNGKIVKVDESVNEREYNTEERKSMADSGEALPDGSYPIADEEDLKNAIQSFGLGKNHSAAAKHIAKRAKALGLSDLIPDTEDFQKALKS